MVPQYQLPLLQIAHPTVRNKIDHWWSTEFAGTVFINPTKRKGFLEPLNVMGMHGPDVMASSLTICKIL